MNTKLISNEGLFELGQDLPKGHQLLFMIILEVFFTKNRVNSNPETKNFYESYLGYALLNIEKF